MAFSALLGQRFLVGIGTNVKAAERAVRFTTDKLVGCGDEVFLVHVIVLSPNYLSFADSRSKQVQRMVDKKLAPLFSARRISYRLHIMQITLPLFMGQNPAYLVGHALCSKANTINAAAIVVAGSGKDNLALTILMGHSISYTVARTAAMPVVLVGSRRQPQVPDLSRVRMNPDLIPSLARHDVIAPAA